MGLAIVLVHLAGRYSTRRKYYEPLASEDFAVSIVLAMLDAAEPQLLLRLWRLHDYGRAVLPPS
uniref:RUN domain-containing protein n=1 Tax=Macrostomum lignano TaxID=282301 RepID=A0A1I8FL29_9PLAT